MTNTINFPQRPTPLQKGDLVRIVAPSGKLDDSLENAVALLNNWGVEVKLGKYLFENHGTFAAKDAHRLADLQEALDDPHTRAIFCARGGYGITRILDQIDFTKFIKSPKWVIGYSDITALHVHLLAMGWQSLHAPMAAHYPERCSYEAFEALRAILFGKSVTLNVLPHTANQEGAAEAILVGGNLAMLHDALSTPSDWQTTGRILYLEEVNEKLYAIDRMMTHLLRAGKLHDLAGLVIGHFDTVPVRGNEFALNVEEIVLEKVARFNYPVGFQFPIGHHAHNMPIVNGAMGRLSVTKQSITLSF